MNEPLPSSTRGDDLHLLARSVLSEIPYVGGLATELFNRLLAPPIQRRRDAWLNDLAERLAELERRGRAKIEKLSQNEEFVSTVIQATRVAVQNHQREKINALRNAISNAALGLAPGDSKRELFIRLIDEFGVWHLRVLALLADPPGWFAANRSDLSSSVHLSTLDHLLQIGMPELATDQDFYSVLKSDLSNRGMIDVNNWISMLTTPEDMPKRTTKLGDEFLKFISDNADELGEEVALQ